MKKIVLVSYVVEADTDVAAIFALRRSLAYLPEGELEKFEAFNVVDFEGNQVEGLLA
jgi:hypothetical protein